MSAAVATVEQRSKLIEMDPTCRSVSHWLADPKSGWGASEIVQKQRCLSFIPFIRRISQVLVLE